MKPIFRWVVPGDDELTRHMLRESICRTISALGKDDFEWVVTADKCDNVRFVRHLSSSIRILEFPETHVSGDSEWFAKFRPSRLDINRHEIVAEPGVFFNKKMPELEAFLQGDGTMLMDRGFRFSGTYSTMLQTNRDAHIYGLPAGYDFDRELSDSWKRLGSLIHSSLEDVNALIVFVLASALRVTLPLDRFARIESEGRRRGFGGVNLYESYVPNGTEGGVVFVPSDRHRSWNFYRLRSTEVCEYEDYT